jgi:hypothetical protein
MSELEISRGEPSPIERGRGGLTLLSFGLLLRVIKS